MIDILLLVAAGVAIYLIFIRPDKWTSEVKPVLDKILGIFKKSKNDAPKDDES